MTEEKIKKIYELFSIAYKGYKEGARKFDQHLYSVLTKYPEVRDFLSKEELSDSLGLVIEMNNNICNQLESKVKSQDAGLRECREIICSQNDEIIGLASRMQEMVQ